MPTVLHLHYLGRRVSINGALPALLKLDATIANLTCLRKRNRFIICGTHEDSLQQGLFRWIEALPYLINILVLLRHLLPCSIPSFSPREHLTGLSHACGRWFLDFCFICGSIGPLGTVTCNFVWSDPYDASALADIHKSERGFVSINRKPLALLSYWWASSSETFSHFLNIMKIWIQPISHCDTGSRHSSCAAGGLLDLNLWHASCLVRVYSSRVPYLSNIWVFLRLSSQISYAAFAWEV